MKLKRYFLKETRVNRLKSELLYLNATVQNTPLFEYDSYNKTTISNEYKIEKMMRKAERIENKINKIERRKTK